MSFESHYSRKTRYHKFAKPLELDLGGTLPEFRVAYRTWGSLNKSGDNAIMICHALTGSADAYTWWRPLFGQGRTFDPTKYFIICSNVLGSCYGTTGPTSINPMTGRAYGPDFPLITVRDMVKAQYELSKVFGIQKFKMVVGGSLGGMQVLEWAAMYPEMVEAFVPIATTGRHSAWCIGLSECQRQSIYADPNWQNGYYRQDQSPKAGLAAARMLAMCTYRSRASLEARFSRTVKADSQFNIQSYLQYQGEKLVERFDANTYVTLTKAMDQQDIARGRGEFYDVLGQIKQSALVVAINSDVLYPQEEQEELARFMPNARLDYLYSPHGHDAFLIEMEALDRKIIAFRNAIESIAKAPSSGGFSNDGQIVRLSVYQGD
ncbi:MAG: homoserine O-acetyltransferase [Chlorobiales bacterium]|nr:homoserine O-acetyltransferase [Chlorobiales bacterium]